VPGTVALADLLFALLEVLFVQRRRMRSGGPYAESDDQKSHNT
jgi:hypothetical protein